MNPQALCFPSCGRWDCDDDYDWEWVNPDDPEYQGVKREHRIVTYHQPRGDWPHRLQAERDKRNEGKPLWARCSW